MPKFLRAGAAGNADGFDSERTLQALTIRKSATFYLENGAGLVVQIQNSTAESGRSFISLTEEDSEKLTSREKSANYRKFVVTGLDLGATTVTAGPLTTPLRIVVVKNGAPRIFDGGNDAVPPQIVGPMKAYGLRGAAIRIAEDQMASTIGHTSGTGAGMYMAGTNDDGSLYDWCGGFVQWCYQNAARLIGETNPFGGTAWALASPERAISWAMAHPLLATVLQYQGETIMDYKNPLYGGGTKPPKQNMNNIQIAAHGNPANITEGDICLHRHADGTWKHVCMVYNVAGGETFDTINGNPKIWIDKGLKYSDKVAKGLFKYAFLHLSLPDVDWVSGWNAESQVAKGG